MRVKHLRLTAVAFSLGLLPLAARAGRPLNPEDWYRFKDISTLTMAPDGAAVAYLVTSYEKKSDSSRNALWTVDWSGKEPLNSPAARAWTSRASAPTDDT